MAHLRKFLPCLRYSSRAVLQCERQSVSKYYRKAIFNHGLLYIPAQNFTEVAAAAQQNLLKQALQNCSIWDVMTHADKKRDVYVFGMEYATTPEQIESFFSGLDIEEIYTIDSSRARIKKFFYIRFKDEESKKKALLKNKQQCGNRYVEISGIENPKVLGLGMLYHNALNVKLSNLPFTAQKEEVMEWLKPLEVHDEDVFFVSRGVCAVRLHDKASSIIAQQKKESAVGIGQRRVYVDPFVNMDDIVKLEKYCEEKTQQK